MAKGLCWPGWPSLTISFLPEVKPQRLGSVSRRSPEELFFAFVDEQRARKTGIGNEKSVEAFDFAEVTFDLIIGEVVGPILIPFSRFDRNPETAPSLMVPSVATEVDNEVILWRDQINQAVESAFNAPFGGFGIFD